MLPPGGSGTVAGMNWRILLLALLYTTAVFLAVWLIGWALGGDRDPSPVAFSFSVFFTALMGLAFGRRLRP